MARNMDFVKFGVDYNFKFLLFLKQQRSFGYNFYEKSIGLCNNPHIK